MKTTMYILMMSSALAGQLRLGIPVNQAAGAGQPLLLRSVYTGQLGVREETGRNDGPAVEQYLHYVGLRRGEPWCAAFVCWCLGQCRIPNPRSGYCPRLFSPAKVIWRRQESSSLLKSRLSGQEHLLQPRQGDVFGLYIPEKKRIAHTGFVDQWGDLYVITTEGNTNEAGSREGDGVYRKRRLISSISCVARYCKGKEGL